MNGPRAKKKLSYRWYDNRAEVLAVDETDFKKLERIADEPKGQKKGVGDG